MKDIWVISDTHFGHQNIIDYCDRPFRTHHEMDQCMVDNWNSVVKPGDKVYHLGDVYMGSGEYAWEILKRLHGQKRLILGNHDDAKNKVLTKWFQKINLWRVWNDHKLMMTHVPVNPMQLRRSESLEEPIRYVNIHGHIHNNPSPEGPYRCVCVEQINYTPIHIEELRMK